MMKNLISKKLLLFAVKYGPTLMGVSCIAKCLLLSATMITTPVGLAIHLINLLLNILILFIFYIQGIALEFCDKHRNICYLVLFGYILYGANIILGIPFTLSMIVVYSILLIIFTIIFYIQSK